MAEMLIQCPSCNATNRVSEERLGDRQAVCGRCKALLALHPITITDANFSTEVEESQLPVLLDMWAAWCGPCRIVAPIVEQLATELAGRVRIAKLNVDENPSTAERFGVRSIPTLLILKNGRELTRIVGAQPKQAILNALHSSLSKSPESL